MASVPIKFRCYRCNQLLGVAPSKAGTAVACIKCGAELIVPEPEDPSASPLSGPTPYPDETSEYRRPSAVGPNELLDINPEDIRVRPGFVPFIPPAPSPAEEPEGPPQYALGPDEVTVEDEPDVAPNLMNSAATVLVSPPPAPASVIPPIHFDEPLRSTAPRRAVAPPPRSRDLVIPRSVVTAWSLFVLLALGFAFFAGLLAGHFIWRVH